MTRLRLALLRAWALVLLSASTMVVANAPMALRVPGEVDAARLWQDVLDGGDYEAIYAGYRRLAALWPEDGEVDVETCVAQREQLDADLRVNPVGVALWWVSSLCAQAMGDEARAERDIEAFAALVRYAMAPVRPHVPQDTPIRILSEYDMYAIVEVSGQTSLYSYYDTTRWGRHLPLHVALWDARTQRERLLVFDMLDSMVRLNRGREGVEAPVFRFVIADALIKRFGQDAGTPGEAGLALLEALRKSTPDERTAALLDVSARGLTGAVLEMGRICLADSRLGCAEAAVDAVLPLAERRLSRALVLLAVANSTGRGIDMDAQAANALLDSADRELGAALGSQMFLSTLIAAGLPLHPDVGARLHRLAGDDDMVAALLIVHRGSLEPDHAPAAHESLRLRRAAADGPASLSLAYAQLSGADSADGVRWMQRAADTGVRAAQELLADAYFSGLGVERDAERGEYWLAQAAQDGSVTSALRLAWTLRERGEARRAQYWLEGVLWLAEQDGHPRWPDYLDAVYDYAELTAYGLDGAVRDPGEALRVLRRYADDPQAVRERQLLAELLIDGHGGRGADDRSEAVRWLRTDIANGNARSMAILGSAALSGRIPSGLVGNAGTLLRTAAQRGDLSAMSELAMAIYARRLGATRPDEIRYWLGKAADAGSRLARNNLAWLLCVAADPALHDPVSGLRQAELLARESDLPPGFIDTLAACDAANGKSGRAVMRQKQAIALLKQRGAAAAVIEPYREHLVMFQRGEAVRESFD